MWDFNDYCVPVFASAFPFCHYLVRIFRDESCKHQDVTMKDAESGQAGGVSDELVSDEPASHIPLDYESSDDDLVQDVLDEMKETTTSI